MVLFSSLRRLVLTGMIVIGLSMGATSAQATSYSDLVVFGDSLSDSGNIYDLFGGLFGPSAPYTEGRFTSPYSNGDPGLVWVEHLAGLMGFSLDNSLAGGSNYAYGGARVVEDVTDLVPSLPDQVNTFMANNSGVADPNALYVVFGGGNDVRDNNIAGAAASVGAMITDLAAAGATDFFVPTLPDIGLTPESQAGLAPGGTAAEISQAAADYNAEVLAEVALLQVSLGVNIVTFDLFGLFNDLLSDPGAFGLTNVTDACAGINAGDVACLDPDSYLFFDGIHPTAITHEMIAGFAFDRIQAVPLPAALPLMLAALGLLGLRSRKA